MQQHDTIRSPVTENGFKVSASILLANINFPTVLPQVCSLNLDRRPCYGWLASITSCCKLRPLQDTAGDRQEGWRVSHPGISRHAEKKQQVSFSC